MLAAVLGPFHRPADVARRERDQEILRIELAARAEAAADVVLDHVDGIVGEAELLGEDAAVEEQHLGGARHASAVPLAASHSASRPRGSIGSAVWRCTLKRSRRV